MKKISPIVGVFFAVAVLAFIYFQSDTPSKQNGFDGRNSSFVIDGQQITLVNGIFEESIVAGSASKNMVRYFGNEAYGDLNSDGMDDTVFLITQDLGGSGTFFYAVAAVKTNTGYKTTNAYFIGDRIAPQSTVIDKDSGEIRVNYADRKKGESMSAAPTEGATLRLEIASDNVLGLVK